MGCKTLKQVSLYAVCRVSTCFYLVKYFSLAQNMLKILSVSVRDRFVRCELIFVFLFIAERVFSRPISDLLLYEASF